GMLRQISCQPRIPFVTHLHVNRIELVVRLLPAFPQKSEPISRDCEQVQIVVEPYRLWFERESGDRIVGHVHLLPVIFKRQVGQPLKPDFASEEEMDGSMRLSKDRDQERRLS